MAKGIMLVLSNSKPEVDDEFNDWYSNVHIVDVVNKLGFESAQRFRLADSQTEEGEFQYLAIYEIPDGKVEEVQQAQAFQRRERAAAQAAGRKPWISSRAPELFGGEHRSWFFEAIDEPYEAGSRPDSDEGAAEPGPVD